MKMKSMLTLFTALVNNKLKKWAFFAILFFFLLSLDDYSVATLDIPPIEQLNVTKGTVQLELAGGSKGASNGDLFYLLNNHQRVKFNCRIGTRDNSSCIARSDSRFYDKAAGGESWLGKTVFFKPNTSQKLKHAQVWWYEANIFGPLKEKRLLQLDVEGERIIGYDLQKEKYISQKSNHSYMLTILLIFSIIWFCVLQLVNQSLNIQKEK